MTSPIFSTMKPTATIEVIARGVLIHERRVLLCQNRAHGHRFLPGGHVEFGEPAAAALERELREELGIDLVAGRFLGACEASFVQPLKATGAKRSQRHHEINLVFELTYRHGGKAQMDQARLGDLVSQERHIAFAWEPIESLLGPEPTVQVYPRSIVGIIARASELDRRRADAGASGVVWASEMA